MPPAAMKVMKYACRTYAIRGRALTIMKISAFMHDKPTDSPTTIRPAVLTGHHLPFSRPADESQWHAPIIHV